MQSLGWWPKAAGIFIGVIGLLLAIEGIWLAAVGGTWAYLIGGFLYLIVGALMLLRRTAAFWLHLALFVAVLIWSFWETGFHQMTVFTALPRLDVPMIIAVLLMLPWTWRGYRDGALPALVPGAASLALLVIGIGVMISMPWVEHPDSGPAASAQHVTLPPTDAAPGDWPSWGRTKGQSRYSPLDQINTQNVAQLTRA